MAKSEALERYKIIKKLGEGGMGKVYKAHDLELNKVVAIKTLLPQALSDEKAIAQFKKEVSLAQELRHNNIIATYDFKRGAEIPFLVMEYVDGQTLSNYIFRQPNHRLDEETFIKIANQILDGVEHAHKKGVVHKDLKPGNIMITKEGEVKIMDFGIAASLKETYSRSTGQPISLAIHYSSPEQINGEEPSPGMDIYSLGCVFYEMLRGDPPFTHGDILHQQLTKQPAPLEHISPRLNSLILKCLGKRKEERFQDIRELKSTLNNKDKKELFLKKDTYTFGNKEDIYTTKKIDEIDRSKQMESIPQKAKVPRILKSIVILLVLALCVLGYLLIDLILREKTQVKNEALIAQREVENKEYQRKYILAEEYFKNSDYSKALENARKAKTIKYTDEIKQLEDRIEEKIEELKENEFNKYFSRANKYFKEANYKKARDNIKLAKKIKNSSELNILEKKIDSKLAEEKLKEKPKISISYGDTVTVDDEVKFINAIEPHRTIRLKNKTYNISQERMESLVLKNKYIEWGYEGLILKNVNGLSIEARNGAKILVDDKYHWVLEFKNSKKVRISNVTFGHTTPGYCSGGVLSFNNSEDIEIKNSILYGSGTIGIGLYNVRNFRIENSTIKECTYQILSISGSSNIIFEKSTFSNTGEFDLIEIGNSSHHITFSNCTIKNNWNGKYSPYLFNIKEDCEYIYLKDSKVVDNKIIKFINDRSKLILSNNYFSGNTFTDYSDVELENSQKTVEREKTTSGNVLKTGISAGGGGGYGPGSGSGTDFFPYAYYIETLRNKIGASWYSGLVSPGQRGKFLVVVYFKILRNGQITDLKIEKKSGIRSLDLSALRAIENAAPFTPLSGDYPYSYLPVSFNFAWGEK